MSSKKPIEKKIITIDPVGRTEGHLAVTLTVEKNKVTHAKAYSPVYRGFEKIMIGRDPREAQDLPTRICGVCPMVHSVCGNKNMEMLFGVPYNENARLMRNISHATHMIGDHALHFYHLALLDYVKGPDKPPFTPRYGDDFRIPKKENDEIMSHYIQALEIRRISQEAATIFVGKLPHAISFVPGGVTETPTKEKIEAWQSRFKKISDFVNNVWQKDVETVRKYYPDYNEIGSGPTDYLSFGVFELDNKDSKHYHRRGAVIDGKYEKLDLDLITEDVTYTWQDGKDGKKPTDADTKTGNPDKKDAYSFITAARYKDRAVEVGPFARLKVDGKIDGHSSTMARHHARVDEALHLAPAVEKWVSELKLNESGMIAQMKTPKEGISYGLSEAPRGACGHWMEVKDGKISHWQTIPATNWNGSPRDAKGNPGPFELALADTPIENPDYPVEAMRVVRSFDPCMACSVHVIKPNGDLKKFVINPF